MCRSQDHGERDGEEAVRRRTIGVSGLRDGGCPGTMEVGEAEEKGGEREKEVSREKHRIFYCGSGKTLRKPEPVVERETGRGGGG